jgi:AraC-like DNA-binding protein
MAGFKRISFCCLVFFFGSLGAQPTFISLQKEVVAEYDLHHRLFAFQSSDSLYFPAQLIAGFDAQFLFNAQDQTHYGYSKKWFWQSFWLENKQEEALTCFLLTQSASIFFYDFWLVDMATKRVVKEVKTGFERPFRQRDVANRFFVFKIVVPEGGRYQVFTRVHNKAGSLMQPMRLLSEEGFEEYLFTSNFFVYSIFSLWFLACVIALLLYFSFREAIYFYYFGYIFCLMMFRLSYEGLALQYFWPNSPFLADVSRMFYVPATMFLFAFVYPILKNKVQPLVLARKTAIVLSMIAACFVMLSGIPPDLFPQRNYVVIGMNVFVLAMLVLILVVFGLKLREKYRPTYMLLVAISPVIVYACVMIFNFWGVIKIDHKSYFSQFGFSICALLEIAALFWMLLFRFKNIQRLQNLSAERILLYSRLMAKRNASKTGSYSLSKYSKEEVERVYGRLKEWMEIEKPFVDPTLSLNSLAQQLACHPNLLSQCVNQMEGKNFSEFVNQHRVALSQELLSNEKFADRSVEAIAFEVGFSSKSVFFTAFKKQTGMTPSEYRKK